MPAIPTTELFWSHVPREYLRKVFRGLLELHPQTHASVRSRHREPAAINVEPFELRASVQELLEDAAEFFKGQVSVKTSWGEQYPTWWSHARAECGPVILTANTAASADEIIAPSGCRLQYSQQTDFQRSLFEDMEDEVPPPADEWLLYGMLLHGRGTEKRGTLGFATIRFPLPDLTGYQVCRIDLFKEFPDVVESFRSSSDGADSDDDGLEFLEGEDLG